MEKGVISNGKEVLLHCRREQRSGGCHQEKYYKANSDTGFLEQLAKDVLAQNEKSVNDYKNGKTNALGYLVGQCMKASRARLIRALSRRS